LVLKANNDKLILALENLLLTIYLMVEFEDCQGGSTSWFLLCSLEMRRITVYESRVIHIRQPFNASIFRFESELSLFLLDLRNDGLKARLKFILPSFALGLCSLKPISIHVILHFS